MSPHGKCEQSVSHLLCGFIGPGFESPIVAKSYLPTMLHFMHVVSFQVLTEVKGFYGDPRKTGSHYFSQKQ